MNKIKNTKQAFTFAELMISLVVIAIITVILYPTLADMAPNNNRYLFKSAYRTIETVTSDVMNTSALKTMPTTQTDLCNAFCERLNTISIKNAAGDAVLCDNACTNFKTSNGMRWAFSVNGANAYVLVDVNTANNTKSGDTSGDTASDNIPNGAPNISTVWDGSSDGVFYTADDTTQDTFLFVISRTGKITPHGTVAAHHMQSGN